MTVETPAFISEQNVRRNAHFDASIRYGAEALALPEVRSGLGRFAAGFDYQLNRLVMPNMSHGVVEILRGKHADDTPFVPMSAGERLLHDPRYISFNRNQYHSLTEQFSDHNTTETHTNIFEARKATELPVLFQKPRRHESVEFSAVEKTLGGMLITRPMYISNMDEPGSVMAPVVLHALMHVQQCEDTPYYPTKDNYGQQMIAYELEAYDVSKHVITGMTNAGQLPVLEKTMDRQTLDAIDKVNNVRLKHNGLNAQNPYAVCDDLIEDVSNVITLGV